MSGQSFSDTFSEFVEKYQNQAEARKYCTTGKQQAVIDKLYLDTKKKCDIILEQLHYDYVMATELEQELKKKIKNKHGDSDKTRKLIEEAKPDKEMAMLDLDLNFYVNSSCHEEIEVESDSS